MRKRGKFITGGDYKEDWVVDRILGDISPRGDRFVWRTKNTQQSGFTKKNGLPLQKLPISGGNCGYGSGDLGSVILPGLTKFWKDKWIILFCYFLSVLVISSKLQQRQSAQKFLFFFLCIIIGYYYIQIRHENAFDYANYFLYDMKDSVFRFRLYLFVSTLINGAVDR